MRRLVDEHLDIQRRARSDRGGMGTLLRWSYRYIVDGSWLWLHRNARLNPLSLVEAQLSVGRHRVLFVAVEDATGGLRQMGSAAVSRDLVDGGIYRPIVQAQVRH